MAKEERQSHRALTRWQLAPLGLVVLAPVAASWVGLTEFGRSWAHLSGVLGYLVPLVLDAAALYVAILAWRATIRGEAAGMDRLLVLVYAATSAALNVWHGIAYGGAAQAIFFGIASLSAAVLWERTLKHVRPNTREKDAPAPKFRTLRWLLAPGETARAWRHGVLEGISSPQAALTAYRANPQGSSTTGTTTDLALLAFLLLARSVVSDDKPAEPAAATVSDSAAIPAPRSSSPESRRPRPQHVSEPEVASEVVPELVGLSQPKALRVAFAELRTWDVPAAREWLAERGVRTNRRNAYKARDELRSREPELVAEPAAVEGPGSAEAVEVNGAGREEARRLAVVAGP